MVAGTRAIGQPPAPVQRQAGIKGALGDKDLSSGRPLERSTERTEEALFIQPRPRPIRLVWSGQALSPTKAPAPLKGELSPNVLETLSEFQLEDRSSFGLLTGTRAHSDNGDRGFWHAMAR